MPWKVEKDTNACPAGKPWAVKNTQTGDVRGRCHASKSDAINQMRALYVHAMNEKTLSATAVNFAEATVEDNLLWFEALPAKTWHTAQYGEIPVTTDKLERMIFNLKSNVRGQDIATDYEHGRDASKGTKASGWIRDADIRDRQDGSKSLWLAVEPTPTAKQEILNKEWRYFSLEWEDSWKHPETQEEYQDVITGGGFTNRPVAKGMMPINFSEVLEAEPSIIAEMAPDFFDEHAAEEHHDPGQPPDFSINRDDSADTGSRIETPPIVKEEEEETPTSEGGETVNEEELRALLGIAADVDINAHISDLQAKAEQVDSLRGETASQRAFSEQYPEQAKELSELRELRLNDEARRFSDAVAGMRFSEGAGDDKKESTKGLSSLAIETIAQTARKFSEGTVTIEDFKSSITAILDNGVVDYGQAGSARVDERNMDDVPTDPVEVRRMFAERVSEIQVNDTEGDFNKALGIAAQRYPKLAEAYARPPALK
jgi:Mu-like prophage I protein